MKYLKTYESVNVEYFYVKKVGQDREIKFKLSKKKQFNFKYNDSDSSISYLYSGEDIYSYDENLSTETFIQKYPLIVIELYNKRENYSQDNTAKKMYDKLDNYKDDLNMYISNKKYNL